MNMQDKNIKLGINAYIQDDRFISDCNLGDYSFINSGCNISNLTLGKYSQLGPNVVVVSYGHDLTRACMHSDFDEDWIKQEFHTIIGNDVWVGANVTIDKGVTIGDGAVIAANSYVNKDVAPYSIVGGCPAKFIKNRFSEDIVKELLELKWWDLSYDELYKLKDSMKNPETFISKIKHVINEKKQNSSIVR